MWLSGEQFSDLEAARLRTDLTAAALFRRFLRETAHARKLETQGKRKVEIDSMNDLPRIESLLDLADAHADMLGRKFRRTHDPVKRTTYHEDLRVATDDVVWLHRLIDKLGDAEVRVADPTYRPRHRYVGEPPSHPAASASSAQGDPLSAT